MNDQPLAILPELAQTIKTLAQNRGWIGFDLDGTLARYDGWVSHIHIGPPIHNMLIHLKSCLSEGWECKIVTARAYVGPDTDEVGFAQVLEAKQAIRRWCLEHVGQELDITATKDFRMVKLYDDRCVQVIPNTGVPLEAITAAAYELINFLSQGAPDGEEKEAHVGELLRRLANTFRAAGMSPSGN